MIGCNRNAGDFGKIGGIIRRRRQCEVAAQCHHAREHQQQSAEPLHGPNSTQLGDVQSQGRQREIYDFDLVIFSGCDGLGHAG
jgi:hypothetical protein